MVRITRLTMDGQRRYVRTGFLREPWYRKTTSDVREAQLFTAREARELLRRGMWADRDPRMERE